ncbi:MAG: chloride channel protein [Nibricoccus sp.]
MTDVGRTQNATGFDKRAAEAHGELADFSTNHRVLVLSALAIPIGVVSTFVAKGLLWLIAVLTNLAFFGRFSTELVTLQQNFGWRGVLVPAVGGLIIGLMARYGSEKIRGHGIPEALEAILLGRSLIKPKVAILKPVSSAISIGTGGPFGAEGPIIMTGGACGSLFAQLFHLTSAERKTLLVAGAAAGMAAVFSTPIAAVLLAVELLLFEWKPRSFIPVSVAASVAAVLRVPLLGAGPIFPVPAHAALTSSAMGVAVLVGVGAGLLSGLLTALVYACEDAFQKLPIHWMWWPAIGGLAVGIGALWDPRVLGVGYEIIHDLALGKIAGVALLTLVISKSVVWSVSLGSGTSGGVLAPLLMIGGAAGTCIGSLTGIGDNSLWAMTGMAAMMGGTMRSPLTGMIFLLEMTHDLNALPALLVGTVAALCVTVLLLKRSILTEKLARRGQHIAREYSVDVFELTRVGEVMDKAPSIIPADTTVSELMRRVAERDAAVAKRQGVLVVSPNGELVGLLTRGDLFRAQQKENAEATSVAEIATKDLVVAYTDETLRSATEKMLRQDIGRLPVVGRDNPRKLLGYLGRSEILAAQLQKHSEEETRERGLFLLGSREVH